MPVRELFPFQALDFDQIMQRESTMPASRPNWSPICWTRTRRGSNSSLPSSSSWFPSKTWPSSLPLYHPVAGAATASPTPSAAPS